MLPVAGDCPTCEPSAPTVDERLQELVDSLYSMASLDFTRRPTLRGDGSLMDAAAGCILMLSEELSAYVEQRGRIEEELEARVNERTAQLECALEEARDARRLTEERADQLAEVQKLAHLGGWEADLSTDRIAWTDELYRIFGVDSSELDPTFGLILERVHPDDRDSVIAAVDAARRERHGFDIEHRIVRPGGEVRTILCRGRLITDEAGQPVRMVGTIQDLTDRRALEARMRQGEKLAALGQLAGGVAHEINNPLSVILGFAQGLERRMPETNPFRIPVASIAREAVRCKNLVQELLTFSRTAKRSTEPIDLNELVRSTVVLLEARAKTQSVEIVCELDPGAPHVQANRNQLQQILVNLGTNSLDATKGGGTITIRSACGPEGAALLSVADTGCGIPQAVRDRIFEPFFTTKEVGEGTGLGLSLVYEIVQQHEGRIDVESHLGRGTTISVHLPGAQDQHP